MNTDLSIATSLSQAINNDYVFIEDDDESSAERFIGFRWAAERKETRTILLNIVKELDKSVQQVDKEISDVLKEFQGEDIESVKDVMKHLDGEIDQIASVHAEVMQNNTKTTMDLSQFSESYANFRSSAVSLDETAATTSILAEIQEWSKVITRIENALENEIFDSISDELLSAMSTIEHLEKRTPNLGILPKMREHIDTLTASVKKALETLWNRMISVDIEQNESSLSISDDSEALNRLTANMNAHGLLNSAASTLSSSLQANFIQLLLTATYSITCDTALVIRKEASSQQPEIVFPYLKQLTDFLTTRLPHMLLPTLTATLLPTLTNDIINQFLPSRIPTSLIQLPAFDLLLDTVMQFNQYLVHSGWARGTSLSFWVYSASETWFNNRLAIFLDETRYLLSAQKNPKIIKISQGIDITDDTYIPSDENKVEKRSPDEERPKSTVQPVKDVDEDETDGWGFDDTEEVEVSDEIEVPEPNNAGEVDSWEWGEEPEEPEEPEDRNLSTTDSYSGSFPYVVSVIPDGLMDIIQNVLDEREQLQSESYSRHAVAKSAGDYPMMIAHILMTWRVVSSLGAINIPTDQRMRLSNDASYLARRLSLYTDVNGITNEIQRLNDWSNLYLKEEMTRISNLFAKKLSTTNGFENCAQPEQYQRCNEAILFIETEMRTLSDQYKNILPPKKSLMILGELLSSVLLYIDTSLTLLTDISADESTFLIVLYSSLFSLGGLFAPLEPHQICAEWQRSHSIRGILEWSMVDIMKRWRAGLLQDVFTSEEMIGWLKKLFQASDMRAKNIAELQR